MGALGYDYQMFRHSFNAGYLPSYQYPMQPYVPAHPEAVIMQAPEDPPWPPAVIFTHEYLMNFFEGLAVAVLLLLFIISRGQFRLIVVLVAIGVAAFKYMEWKETVAQFKAKEKEWQESRMWPLQNQPRYIIQNTATFV